MKQRIKNFIRPSEPSDDNFFERKRLMKFNRFFSNPKVFTTFYIIAVIIAFFLIVWALKWLENFSIEAISNPSAADVKDFTYLDAIKKYWIFEIVFAACAAAGYLRFAYLVKVSHGEINVGQKGTARWTTREELRKQYKWVKENEFIPGGSEFPGKGGIPIAREGDEIAIDDSTTNNLIIGITRSGKGQIVVNTMIDILSRAGEKCSMVITDPKLELSSLTIPKLIERGYDCHILNLIDPEYSTGYNPYKTIIDEYKHGNESTAQQLCASLAYNIFAPQPGERDPYWNDQARNVFIAITMAEIEDAIKADMLDNRRYKRLHEIKESERKEKYYRELYGDDYILFKIKQLVETELSEKNLSCSALAAELSASAAPEIKEYIRTELPFLEDIEDEDSVDYESHEHRCAEFFSPIFNLRLKESEFKEIPYIETSYHEERVTIYSVIKMCNTLMSVNIGKGQTMLDFYFDSRPEDNFARIAYGAVISAAENTKGTIMSVFRNKLEIFSFEAIAKMTAKSTIDFADIAFSEKPIAIFIGLPDYDASNHFIATVFINQMYFTLAKLATAMPGGKLPRRVHFILDEFGNLPALDNMSNITTVCLGREIVFTFIIQAMSQVDNLYGENASTIIGNCGNQIFIMTADENTAENFSKILSTESIITTNRTGKKLSANKELTEMVDERPLLTAYELMHLEKGEMIVARYMKREDMKGNAIKATPIANMGEYRMKFAYEFLEKTFPSGWQLYESPNLGRIQKKGEEYKQIQLKLTDVDINTTMSIDLKSCAREAQKYIDHQSWRAEAFPCDNELYGNDYVRMNIMFDIINAAPDEQKIYKLAGKMVITEGAPEILYPDMVILNGALEDYAYKLLESSSRQVKEKGYKLLDLILPLPKARDISEIKMNGIENSIIKEIQRRGGR